MSFSLDIIERKFRRVSPIVERTSFFIRFNFDSVGHITGRKIISINNNPSEENGASHLQLAPGLQPSLIRPYTKVVQFPSDENERDRWIDAMPNERSSTSTCSIHMKINLISLFKVMTQSNIK